MPIGAIGGTGSGCAWGGNLGPGTDPEVLGAGTVPGAGILGAGIGKFTGGLVGAGAGALGLDAIAGPGIGASTNPGGIPYF